MPEANEHGGSPLTPDMVVVCFHDFRHIRKMSVLSKGQVYVIHLQLSQALDEPEPYLVRAAEVWVDGNAWYDVWYVGYNAEANAYLCFDQHKTPLGTSFQAELVWNPEPREA